MAVNYTLHEAHDLEHRVHFVLTRNPYIKSRDIQIEIVGNDVTLKGAVGTYYQKQMAQHSLKQIRDIRRITNELNVVGRAKKRSCR